MEQPTVAGHWRSAIVVLLIASAIVAWASGVDVLHAFDGSRHLEISAAATPAAGPPASVAVPTTITVDAESAASPVPVASPPSPAMTGEIAHYLTTRKGAVAVAIYDERIDTTWTSSNEPVASASVIKVAIAEMTLLNAQEQHRALDNTEQTLARRMISSSDNDAASVLWQRLRPVDNIQRLMNQLGLSDTVANHSWGLTTTTATDQVKLVRLFAFPNNVLTDASRSTMAGLLHAVVPGQRWGISSGPPDGVLVKNGWLPTASGWSVNSIGHVQSRGKNYAIAVLTARQPSQQYGMETIARISHIVWATAAA